MSAAKRSAGMLVLGLACGLAQAQETPVSFENARLITMAGPEAPQGRVVIHRGKIIAAGPAQATPAPAGAAVVQCAGMVIMPGLVDTHTHIGGVGGADGSSPIQPDVRVSDSLNPFDPGFRRAVAGGITTMNIMPGSGHLLSGQTIYVKPRRPGGKTAPTIERLFILDDAGNPLRGIKMANGTNPMRDPPFPGTRGKSAALVRERFIEAREYQAKLDGARLPGGGFDAAKKPPRDLGLEALADAMAGRLVVHHHTHRADDIMTVLRLRDEFGFRVVLHHVSEAWKVPDEIARAGVPCSVIVVDSPGGKLEAAHMSFATGGILEKAGVRVAFHTDDWITDSRLFLRSAGLAVRAGMSREGALRALTIEGARMLDLDSRVGSIEPGKDADLVILSGDPLSAYTHVVQTWIDGEKVFDRTNLDDRLFATGGFGAGNDQTPYMCCAGQGSGQEGGQ